MVEDTENRDRLSKLLRFPSSASDSDLTSLQVGGLRQRPLLWWWCALQRCIAHPSSAAHARPAWACVRLPVNADHNLLLYCSSTSPTPTCPPPLQGYVDRMKEGQAAIYYMAADSVDAARDAPFVEKLIKKGYEVGEGGTPAADVSAADHGFRWVPVLGRNGAACIAL